MKTAGILATAIAVSGSSCEPSGSATTGCSLTSNTSAFDIPCGVTMRNGYRPVRASLATSTRSRTRSNGVLLRPPDSAGGSASVASIAIASEVSWRKTEVAPRRPLPRTTTVNVVPRCPTNGCTDTALGSTRGAKAPPITRRSEAMRRGVIRSSTATFSLHQNRTACGSFVVRVSRPKEIPHEQIELPNVHVYGTPAIEDPRQCRAEFQPVGNRGRPIGICFNDC